MPSAAEMRTADMPSAMAAAKHVMTATMATAMCVATATMAAAMRVVTATMTAATRVMAAAVTATMAAASLRKGEARCRQQRCENDDGNPELRHGRPHDAQWVMLENAGSGSKVPGRGTHRGSQYRIVPNGLPLLVLPSDLYHHAAMRRW
jgi:hypothetical protein